MMAKGYNNAIHMRRRPPVNIRRPKPSNKVYGTFWFLGGLIMGIIGTNIYNIYHERPVVESVAKHDHAETKSVAQQDPVIQDQQPLVFQFDHRLSNPETEIFRPSAPVNTLRPSPRTSATATPPALPTPDVATPADAAPLPIAPTDVIPEPQPVPQKPAEADLNAVPNTARQRKVLQIGAYGRKADADKIVAELAQLGIKTSVQTATLSGKAVYRVRTPVYESAADAERDANILRSKGKEYLTLPAK